MLFRTFAVHITLSIMITALQHIRPSVLRGFAVALGAGFVALAIGIRLLHDWLPGESPLVLLIPFGAGVYLLLSGLLLGTDALKRAIFLLFFIIGPCLSFVAWAGCAVQVFPTSFCEGGT